MYGDLTNQWASFDVKRHVGGNGNLIINFASCTTYTNSASVSMVGGQGPFLDFLQSISIVGQHTNYI